MQKRPIIQSANEPYVICMEWLRSVGSIKSSVSFAEYRLLYRALLQKRPIILSILLPKPPHLCNEPSTVYFVSPQLFATSFPISVAANEHYILFMCSHTSPVYLLCVAVCCSVLQCVAVVYLLCVAVCCGVLRCVAVCCSVLQWYISFASIFAT